MVTEYITVPKERAGLELDEFLALQFPELSKGFLRRVVYAGGVSLDGAKTRPNARLRTDQVVIVEIDEDTIPDSPMVDPGMEIPVLYEDERLLVINKPAGVATEPERWAREKGSLVGALLCRAAELRDDDEDALPFRPRIVHRLDKDTSGVMAAAKDLETERFLRQAFQNRQVQKEYLALVEGEHPLPDGESEELNASIAPDRRRTGRMRLDPRGKQSSTIIRVERRFRGFTLMHCMPLTGRTHQIRVHLAGAGFPLLVDPLYGHRVELPLSEIKRGYRQKPGRPERPLLARLSLHALRLTLPIPGADEPGEPNKTGETASAAGDLQEHDAARDKSAQAADATGAEDSGVFRPGKGHSFEAPIPPELARVLKQLEKVRPYKR